MHFDSFSRAVDDDYYQDGITPVRDCSPEVEYLFQDSVQTALRELFTSKAFIKKF